MGAADVGVEDGAWRCRASFANGTERLTGRQLSEKRRACCGERRVNGEGERLHCVGKG